MRDMQHVRRRKESAQVKTPAPARTGRGRDRLVEGVDVNKRTCTVVGCTKPHRAKGYCSTHYNQRLQPNRHVRERDCAACGKRYVTTRTNGRFCSLDCAHAESHARKALIGPLPWTPRGNTTVARLGGQWVSGPCATCGEHFTARLVGTNPRYCSDLCSRRAHDSRYRDTYGTGYQKWITPKRRFAIYERDNWTCQICAQPVDRTLPFNDDWAPSLDHITPRSKGGDHSDANLRLAHRLCNAKRKVT